MTTLLWTSFYGIIGGLIAWRLGMPGGATVGAMIGSGIYQIASSSGMHAPPLLSVTAQIAVGIVIGFSFNRDLLQQGFLILALGFTGAIVYLFVGLLLALVAWKLNLLDFLTAVFSFSPGGYTNMSIIADAEGAQAATVALIHFVRVVLLFSIVPLLARLLVR